MSIEYLQKLCIEQNKTISLAESCTGGSVSALITSISGSSEYFLGSVVCYSDFAKSEILGVEKKAIEEHSAVSEEVAQQMCEQIRKKFVSTIGVSITGFADPSDEKAGLIYFAIGNAESTVVKKISDLENLSRKEVIERCVSIIVENVISLLRYAEESDDHE